MPFFLKYKPLLISLPILFSCQDNQSLPVNFAHPIHSNQRYISLREGPPNSEMCLSYKAYNERGGNYEKSYQFVRFDSSGFINPMSRDKKTDYDIYFLGGSTTACFEVKNEYKFVNLVDSLLEKKSKIVVNTFNAGYPGNTSISSYNKLLNVIVPQNPDIVVLMHNFNDFILMLYQGDYWSTRAHRVEMRKKVELLRNHNLTFYHAFKSQNKSTIFPKIKDGINDFISKYSETPEGEWKGNRQAPSQINFERMKEDFRSSLLAFIATCQIYNIEPILMTQANFFVTKPSDSSDVHAFVKNVLSGTGYQYEDVRAKYQSFNEIIIEIARKENLLLVDLERGIPKRDKYLLDLVHLNKEGSQLAASLISEALYRHLKNKEKI